MKKLIPAYILSFIIAFMLYIVEPISLFVNNRDDFNYNLGNFIKPMLLIFLLVFIILSLFYTIIYFINKKFSDKLGFFNVIMIISYICFILIYIQGNYMIGNLPKLDGTTPDFSIYTFENIITIVILLSLIGIYVFCCIKYKYEKVINISNYISLAIFAMLFVGFIPSLMSSDLYISKDVMFVNNDNINSISNNKNFLIFVVDAADSTVFNRELEKSEYKDMFKDFTYYPDTLSMYLFTRDAIPHILSGKVNQNETSFREYYNNALDESILIDKLVENNYQINLYEPDIKWNTEKSQIVKNIEKYNLSFSNECYMRQQTKYNLFKYLPFFLKDYSKIDHFSLNSCKTDYVTSAFTFDNLEMYNYIKNNKLDRIDDNYFQFIHIDGAHVPFDLDENLNKIENGTYSQKINSSIKIVNSYLERLREEGTYDNSIIIIMADHGYKDEEGDGSRTNPIFYVKGFDEHHDMIVSNKAVSYADLMSAFSDLLDGKKSTEIFSDIEDERERKFLYYNYLEEDHMEEMVASGKAWDFSKTSRTGIEFNR